MTEKKLLSEKELQEKSAPILDAMLQIMAGNFNINLPVDNPDDVFDALGSAVNIMAEEIASRDKKVTRLLEEEQKKSSELLAVNQQLNASEQQLKAANQQLAGKEAALKQSHDNLERKMDEVNRFNKLMVNRELTMIKLKTEINSLLERLGEPAKYSTN